MNWSIWGPILAFYALGAVITFVGCCENFSLNGEEMVAYILFWPLFALIRIFKGLVGAFCNEFED